MIPWLDFVTETVNTLNTGHQIWIFLLILSLFYKFVFAQGSDSKCKTICKLTSYMKRAKSDSNLKWNLLIEKNWSNEKEIQNIQTYLEKILLWLGVDIIIQLTQNLTSTIVSASFSSLENSRVNCGLWKLNNQTILRVA